VHISKAWVPEEASEAQESSVEYLSCARIASETTVFLLPRMVEFCLRKIKLELRWAN
jgi:hypothetical protein